MHFFLPPSCITDDDVDESQSMKNELEMQEEQMVLRQNYSYSEL